MRERSSTHQISRLQTIALWAIMLIAALLRFRLLLQIEHNIDHAYPVWQALMTLERGIFPLVGQQTSVLIANPPLTGYLFLPLVALIRLPIAPYLLVIALNTLGVLLSFRLMCRLIGVNGALLGAALMAVNPWMIEYSRTSWVQSLLPFLVPALLYALIPVLLGTARHPARRLIVACGLLTITAHSYLLAFMLVIPFGLLILIFRKRINWRALAAGAAIFACAAALYALGLLGQREVIVGRVEQFASAPPHLSSEAWNHAVRLVTGADYEIARGTQAPIADSALRYGLTQGSHTILYALLLLGLAGALVRVVRQRDPKMIILLIWWSVPILLMSYVGQVIHPFYQLMGIPAGYAFVGLALRDLSTLPVLRAALLADAGRRRFAAALVLALLCAHALLMAINSSRYYEETATIPGAHGLTALPLDWGMRLGEAIRAGLPAGGVVLSELDQPFILSSLAGTTFATMQRQTDASVLILPANGGVWVQALPAAADESAPRLMLPDGTALQAAAQPPAQQWLRADTRISSDQGITFAGASLQSNLLQVDFLISERVPGIEGRMFGAFAHIFDASGERVGIISRNVIAGYLWQAGDVHRYLFDLQTPQTGTPPYRIGVGLYDASASLNAIFVTPQGSYTDVLMLALEWTP